MNMRRFWKRLRRLSWAVPAESSEAAMEARLDEEMRFHIDMQTAANRRLGMSPAEARRAALVAFGGRERAREDVRDELRSRVLEELVHDIRYALRVLRRSPSFTVTAVSTLAFGIGATTVIYSVTDHVVLRRLPYANAERLVSVRIFNNRFSKLTPTIPVNGAHFVAWKEACTLCDAIGALTGVGFTMNGADGATRIGGIRVSDELLPMLGARAQLGRVFQRGDDRPGNEHLVVISDGLWRDQLGARRDIVGSTLLLNDVPFTVLGVLAPGFRMTRGRELGALAILPDRADAFVPLALNEHERTTQGEYNYSVIALLKAGVLVSQLRAQLDAVNAALSPRDDNPARTAVLPLRTQMVGPVATPLLLLLAAVGAVLLIVCVNLANLLLARGAARRRESAVRVALGAGSERLVRQALTETLVLALAGGVLGVILSRWGLATLVRVAPANLPRIDEVTLDARVIGVGLLLAAVAGVSFGILPALRFGATAPGDALKESSRGATENRTRRRARSLLIASQVALSALLLVAGGLFLRSFARVLRVDKGFNADRVLAMDVVLPYSAFKTPESREQFYATAMPQLAALPGVVASAQTSRLPLEGESWIDAVWPDDASGGATSPHVMVNVRFVSPTYFPLLGVRFAQGAPFTAADRDHRVVILSHRAAQAVWPNASAVGRQLHVGADALSTVVGVASDVTTRLENDSSLVVYRPYWEYPLSGATLLVRTTGDPAAVAGEARAALRRLSAGVPVSRVRTLDDVVASAVAERRFELLLVALFAATALLTASVGIYGIIAHSIARRTGEIGIRVALGATPFDVRRLVLREGLEPVIAGAMLGTLAAVLLGRVFAGLLFEVSPADPLTLGAVLVLLAGVGVVACWIPARRATKRDAALALRAEG